MQKIAVIDYGMGNLRSVSKAIEHVADDAEVVVSSDAEIIESADRIVWPGQGAARDCMAALQEAELVDTVKMMAASRPFLGICMGYQVCLTHSAENGGVDCLDLIPGEVVRFEEPLLNEGQRLKVPHMGWSEVRQTQSHPLWEGIEDASRFYFAHSYYCVPDDPAVIAGSCHYGHEVVVAVMSQNLFACQFHPEKSARDGLQLLRNFTRWDGCI